MQLKLGSNFQVVGVLSSIYLIFLFQRFEKQCVKLSRLYIHGYIGHEKTVDLITKPHKAYQTSSGLEQVNLLIFVTL